MKKLKSAKEEIGKGKPQELVILLNATIEILSDLGIPMEMFPKRRRERIVMAFLALGSIKTNFSDLPEILKPLRTRDIIAFWNEHFYESIADSSYDDIRRKDLDPLKVAGLVENTGETDGSATNDGTRGYIINAELVMLLRHRDSESWDNRLTSFKENHKSLREELARKRDLHKIEITIPSGIRYSLSSGKHNILQKAIIEDFFPRFSNSCEILYFGDTSNKALHKEEKKLKELGFFKLDHDELPDIVAYDRVNNWMFLVEAVHSSGPMSEFRVLELKQKLKHLGDSLIFVTAFLDKQTYSRYAGQIAWETEVWIAESPDHLIHFNGHKFLGPYKAG